MSLTTAGFPALENEDDVPPPSPLIYPELVDANLRSMLACVGDPTRLRPHIKTHKLLPIVARQVVELYQQIGASRGPSARSLEGPKFDYGSQSPGLL